MAQIEFADFRIDFQIDQPVPQHGRGEGETHAIFLVLDGYCAERLRNQDGKLTASEETCGVAGQGDEIWLGEAADQTPFFERIDGDVDRDPGLFHDAEQEAERRRRGTEDARGNQRTRGYG